MIGEIINDAVVEGASETVESLLRLYKPKLNEALLKEDPLTVTLSMKFRCTDGDVVVETNMNFVLDRVKTSNEERRKQVSTTGFHTVEQVESMIDGKGQYAHLNCAMVKDKRAGRLLDGREWNELPWRKA